MSYWCTWCPVELRIPCTRALRLLAVRVCRHGLRREPCRAELYSVIAWLQWALTSNISCLTDVPTALTGRRQNGCHRTSKCGRSVAAGTKPAPGLKGLPELPAGLLMRNSSSGSASNAAGSWRGRWRAGRAAGALVDGCGSVRSEGCAARSIRDFMLFARYEHFSAHQLRRAATGHNRRPRQSPGAPWSQPFAFLGLKPRRRIVFGDQNG